MDFKFYANWCGYCKQFDPKYKEAEKKARTTLSKDISFGQVNIDENPALAARFFVSRLPSIYHIEQRKVRSLTIPRTSNQLVQLLENNEWESIGPIGYWRSPFGIFGILVGYTGYAVKTISSYSPWLVVGLLSGILICSFGLTYHFSRKESSKVPENEETVPVTQAAGYSTSSSKSKKSPNAKKRLSKRID
ncbi:unnamed protein product [Cunninghamella blakesleeana]